MEWSQAYFEMLLKNAYPVINKVGNYELVSQKIHGH